MSNHIDMDDNGRQNGRKFSLATVFMTIIPLFIVIPFTVLGFAVSTVEFLMPKFPGLPFISIYIIPAIILIVGVIALFLVFKKRKASLYFVLAIGLLFLAFLQLFYGGSAWLIGAVVTLIMVYPLVKEYFCKKHD